MPTAIHLPGWIARLHRPWALALAWLLATGLALAAWPAPDAWHAAAAIILGAAMLLVSRGRAIPMMRSLRPLWTLSALGVIAYGAAQWRIADRFSDSLDPALEGQTLRLTGTVASLPAHTPAGVRFEFRVEAAHWKGEALAIGRGGAMSVPRRLSMGWFAGFHEDATRIEAREPLRAGQRWTFNARLKQPHGPRNPHGFDLERHLFQQGLRASGAVRDVPLAGVATSHHPIERLRQSVRDALNDHLGERPSAGVLAALLLGDQAAIDREDWALFRDTGVSHLMAISGLHVTMFAWAAGGVIGAFWRRLPGVALRCPAPSAARVGGLLAALAYALFAGWGVPAQRTVLMLAVVTALALCGRAWPWPASLLVAAAVVSALDPWALMDVGFWLSFAAVGLLMGAGPSYESPRLVAGLQGTEPAPRWFGRPAAMPSMASPAGGRGARVIAALAPPVRDAVRTQAIATIGLAPLTLVLFHQLSVVGFLANLVAVPWVTLVVTPLAILGMWLPPAWSAGALAVEAMQAGLQAGAGWPWGLWRAAAAPWPFQLAALLGGALAVLPLPAALRLLALPLMLPLLWPAPVKPPDGRFELVAADVGQGTAVIVRTRHHLLLYDAGPQMGRDRDAGDRLVVPLLQARGERHIDQLMLSHRDLDHVGGAASVLRQMSVGELRSSLEPGHPLLEQASGHGARVRPCEAGQHWEWDGVRFEVLHPGAGAAERPLGGPAAGPRPNDRSCVLRITARGFGGDASRWPGRHGPPQVLLTGDIEALAELTLVARDGDALRAPIVLVPHHGSRTSSTPAFVEAVQPRWAVVQAAYRSRFGHPAPDVVNRYEALGAQVLETADCGAWSWRPGEPGPRCERHRSRRHWQHPAGWRDAPKPDS